ncbi:MAG: TetR family transcriptional regulator C-terminal domain-containing protein, partial [Woeseiaceae bacterium]
MSSTTLGDVAREAGLSQGIVNLHFESKENLLTETLRFLADEYKAHFNKTYEKSGPGPADKLRALVELDLRPSICDRRKVAVWFAFWGEVQSRPTYRKICDERDQYYDDTVERLAGEIIVEGD